MTIISGKKRQKGLLEKNYQSGCKKKLYLVFLIDSYKWFPFKTKRKE